MFAESAARTECAIDQLMRIKLQRGDETLAEDFCTVHSDRKTLSHLCCGGEACSRPTKGRSREDDVFPVRLGRSCQRIA